MMNVIVACIGTFWKVPVPGGDFLAGPSHLAPDLNGTNLCVILVKYFMLNVLKYFLHFYD